MIGLVAAVLLAQSTTVVIQPVSQSQCTLPTYGDPLGFDYTYDTAGNLQSVTVTDNTTGDTVVCYVTQKVNVSVSGNPPAATPTPAASTTPTSTDTPAPTVMPVSSPTP